MVGSEALVVHSITCATTAATNAKAHFEIGPVRAMNSLVEVDDCDRGGIRYRTAHHALEIIWSRLSSGNEYAASSAAGNSPATGLSDYPKTVSWR
jgi:hypothetical protein